MAKANRNVINFEAQIKEYDRIFGNMIASCCPMYGRNKNGEPTRCRTSLCAAFEGYVDKEHKIIVLPHCKLMYEDY